ncbi:hypothetical protein [Armatimonas rosea]|uniref:Uncharacterized protein n=1 Tax=Armatimonas rosea TaxID=685828 RepID=A0A7W9SMA7_ARMRO|nr:hypothetical protein [Armatimonas rosea]MBB6048548.1 hypothetical protein [Armatimonas rosea]
MTSLIGQTESGAEMPVAFRTQRLLEAMLFLVLGASWLLLGVIREYGMQYLWIFLIVAFTLAFFPRQALPPSAPNRAHRGLLAASVLGFALVLVNALTNHARYADWGTPVVIFLLGLSFLASSKALSYRAHAVTGGLLMLGAVVYPFLSPAGPSCPSGCWGAGLCLWGSALYGQSAARRWSS